jgi:hypothetical protein
MSVETGRREPWRPDMWLIVALMIAYAISFAYLLFGDRLYGRPHTDAFNTQEILDTRFRYTVDDVRKMLHNFGREGVEKYQRVYTEGGDIIYPFVYGTLLTCLLLQARIPGHPLDFIRYFPLLCVIVDLIENACHYYMLQSYLMGDADLEGKNAVQCASVTGGFLTPLKWSLAYVIIGYWIYLAVIQRCACHKRGIAARAHVD